MANDSALYIRRALVTALKSAGLAGGRVYGPGVPANPVWPFVVVGNSDTAPLRAQCLDGAAFDLIVHTFAKGADEAGCAELNRAVASLLDGKGRALDAPFPARIRRMVWLRSQIIRDTDEASAWHGLVTFQGSVSS
jgi:hypothetical protein